MTAPWSERLDEAWLAEILATLDRAWLAEILATLDRAWLAEILATLPPSGWWAQS